MPTRLLCFRISAADGGTVPTFPKANYEGGTNCTAKRTDSMAITFFVSAVAMTLGTFVAASPHQAAKVWGWQRLANLAPGRRTSFVRWHRAYGIPLCLAGVLVAVDRIVFSKYHH
jgi:hypothetical protein